ncbi:MAG TPA: flagellar motor switch protein FliM, partial [Syntrophobacteraceae bacterium]|nr:flagellar motor switch protein FliM [Syntrophobacteraceae bacterium]
MEKILSQDEVDALLRGISDGEIETEQEKPEEVEGIR